MSLSQKTELARALFRTPPSESVTRISGTATADSTDGTVTVELEDGDVIEVGTIGSVSQGQTVTIHVQRGEAQVIAAEGWGDSMQEAVDEAAAVAEATNQHFWNDASGAHVTEVTQDEWAVTPSGPNVLVNSAGMLLRKALNYLASFTPSAVTFYDGNGNTASNVTATFGEDGIILGEDGQVVISPLAGSRTIVEKESVGDFSVPSDIDLSDVSVFSDLVDGSVFYVRLDVSGGSNTFDFTKGEEHSGTLYSWHADYDGDSTVSIWYEGTYSSAVAVSVIGKTVKRAGILSFGKRSGQNGMFSTSLGEGLIASGDNQTVMGRYNVADTTSALIVGNGSWDAVSEDEGRSNAFTVGWDGEVKSNGTPLVPIGTILDYAAATAPDGYLVCDGSAVSRTTYAALFAVIGTTWGTGDGSTTFNVPDFRGRTSIGSGTGTGGNATAHALASTGGDEALASHSHQASAGGDYKFQAIKNASGVAGSFNLQAHSSGNDRYALASTNSANLTYYTSTQSTGAGNGGNMPPYATVTKIIRAI